LGELKGECEPTPLGEPETLPPKKIKESMEIAEY
jgi:hypothetical protein